MKRDRAQLPGTFSARRWLAQTAFFVLLLAAAFFAAVLVGSTLSPWKVLSPASWTPVEAAVVLDYRLPRTMAAAAVGAALGVSGAALQSLLANPLVEPYLLGMASGGALLSSIGILFGVGSAFALAALSFPGSLAAGFLVVIGARAMGLWRNTGVILVGVMINAFFGAMVQFVYSRADVHRAHEMMTRMLGKLPETVELRTGAAALAAAAAGAVALTALARPLNLLMLGEETARASGVEVEAVRGRVFLITALLTAMAVALAGPLGFVGLVVPHLVRLGAGMDNRTVLPGSALLGAVLVLLADAVSRVLTAVNPVPVGVVTAMGGCPVFLWLLWREGRRGSGA